MAFSSFAVAEDTFHEALKIPYWLHIRHRSATGTISYGLKIPLLLL
jgi:hypothetical protein